MALNSPDPISKLLRPIGAVLVNGAALDARLVLEEFDVEQNAYFSADTFNAKLVLARLPAAYDAAFWGSTDSIEFELRIGYADAAGATIGGMTSLIAGRIDAVDIDWRGGCVNLNGRDHTADLIETKITEKYPNLTASQIATKLAGAHGLTAKVTSTSTQVGQYYKDEHAQLESETTEWDLLTFLAQTEPDFVVYVTGKTLYFGPKPKESDEAFELKYQPPGPASPRKGNFENLTTSRTLTLAKDITVYVRSWNMKQSDGFTVKAQAVGANKLRGGTTKVKGQEFYFQAGNMTKDQALRYAHSKLAELTQHERVITGEMPGDPALTMLVPVRLSGTGTSWDQIYFPDTLHHSLNARDGYRLRVRAKNHSPQSTTGV
jgi:phage protein D